MQRHLFSAAVTVSFFLAGLAGLTSPLAAQCQSVGWLQSATPASGVPIPDGHGLLAPVDEGQLPGERDTTDYNYNAGSGDRLGIGNPLWMDLDVEGDTLFTAVSHGLQVWKIESGGESLRRVGQLAINDVADCHECLPVWKVAAPSGDDDVVAVGQREQGGVVIVKTVSLSSPARVYHDRGKSVADLAANAKGFLYAATNEGVLVYDMNAAKGLTTPCTETTPSSACGIYRGRVTTQSAQGLGTVGNSSGTKQWLAVAGGGPLSIYDVTKPSSPRLVLSGLSDRKAYGVALWRSGSSYYLGLRADIPGTKKTEARIYDVSCIGTDSCSGLGSPIWSEPGLPRDTSEFFVTHSADAGRHYLYLGAFNRCPFVEQNEWLFDVTDPKAAFDLTPEPFQSGFDSTAYWGWYYGFNYGVGLVGKFHGGYFYRAAHSILDIHRLVGGVEPGAAFSWNGASDGRVYVDDPVDFQDDSTGAPDSWAWLFVDGTPGTSTSQHPQDVLFSATGETPVELEACNNVGCASTIEPLTVHATAPQVASIAANPSTVLRCGTVALTAKGPGGQSPIGLPPLSYAWTVDGSPWSGSGSGQTTSWNTQLASTGKHTVKVVAANSLQETDDATVTVTVQDLPPLAISGVSNDDFSANSVKFHLAATGATEWCWDFDDGTGTCDQYPTGWTTDPSSPSSGTDPSHVFTETGIYEVRAFVRNCEAGPLESQPLTVEIENLEPLAPRFRARSCAAWGCTGEAGSPITFDNLTMGDAESYDFDWDGNGTFEDTGNSPSSTFSHTYSSSGSYRPVMKAWRGVEHETFRHEQVIEVSSSVPKTITVFGPSSGEVGQNLSFTASASGCTAAGSGWSWTATGTTVTSNSSSATITFSSAGSKTVRATNSGCSGASGSRSVSVTDPGGGGGVGDCGPVGAGGLQACIQKSVDGLLVSFDGKGSAGSPQTYEWTFGDGNTGGGSHTSHTYAADGAYKVTLSVTKPGDCAFGFCSASHSVNVKVEGKGSPPPPVGSCGVEGEGGLQACFDFLPEEPGVGTEIEFDGSGSKGSPETFEWDFGGGDVKSTTLPDATFLRSFATSGKHDVTLTVSRFIDGSPCPFQVCTASVTRTVEVLAEAPTCSDSETGICLKQGRFRVEAHWWNDQGEGGQATPVRLTGDTAYFWFFQRSNVEIVAKILDGSSLTGHFWVYYASLSSVGFEITVTDTKTGNSKTYRNESGSMASRGDVKALPSTEPTAEGLTFVNVEPSSLGLIPLGEATHESDESCEESETRLCLGSGGQWAVDVTFKDSTGALKQGRAEPITSRTGYFWFFRSTNVELIAKILDGRKVNGKYWVFYASLTDVEFDMTVTDLHTGAQATYHNNAGVLASRGDIDALPGN